MAKPFSRLRTAMRDADVDRHLIARTLGVCDWTVTQKLNNRARWNLDEMYAVLDLLGEPAESLHRYFPPGGQNEEGCSRGKAAVVAGRRVAQGLQKGAGRRN